MTTSYCTNEPCEAEATCVLLTDRGTRCPLCATCREAFEWGQASPDAEIQDINQHTDEDEEGLVEAGVDGEDESEE